MNPWCKKTLLLAAAWTQIAQAGSVAPWDCAGLFSAAERAAVEVTSADNAPLFHNLNAEAALPGIGETVEVLELRSKDVGQAYASIGGLAWKSDWIEKSKRRISLTSAAGERFFFEIVGEDGWLMRSLLGARIKLKRISPEDAAARTEEPAEQFVPPSAPSARDDERTLSELVANQLAAVGAQDLQADHPLFLSLAKANRIMLGALNRGDTLDLEILKAIHKEMVFKESESAFAPTAGVVRGTRESFIKDGVAHEVDLTHWEAQIGAISFGPPASEVPGRLATLLERISRIERGSSFREIVSIYKDFILLQPFTNGNRRAAAIVMDFCLLKAGYSAIPHRPLPTRAGIYFLSLNELTETMAQACSNARP